MNFIKRFILYILKYRLKSFHPGLLTTHFKKRYTHGSISINGRRLYYSDSASFLAIYDEVFHQNIYNFFSNTAVPVILDCGANIGLSAVYFNLLYPNSSIIAFEPDQAAYTILEKNIESLNIKNVTLIKKGLWKEDTILEFHSEGADGGRIDAIAPMTDSKRKQIPVTRLSQYIKGKIDFLKIDIEGAEYEVLLECKDKLHLVKNIFVEYHSFSNQKQSLDEILSILTKAGFRYYLNNSGVRSKSPFIKRKEILGMDLQINIYGYRNHI